MTKNKILDLINISNGLRYGSTKISYYILKPNSVRNYSIIINEIEKHFHI